MFIGRFKINHKIGGIVMFSQLFFESLGYKVKKDIRSILIRFVLIDVIVIVILLHGFRLLFTGELGWIMNIIV